MKGLVRNPKETTKAIDFVGIGTGKIHPSDIDGVLEFDNKYLILMEYKAKGINELSIGQDLLLTRIADAWEKSGKDKKATVLFINHPNYGAEHDRIYAKDSEVNMFYSSGHWYEADFAPLSLMLDRIARKWGCKKLKKFL